jgi:type IV pilus assembly protein PilM
MVRNLLRGGMLRRKAPPAFGLDVGSSAIKVVQLAPQNGGYALRALGMAALPPDAIADGAIKDPPTVVDAIKEAVIKAGIKTREAAVAVCGRELIIKKVQIPEVPAKELHDAIQLEAEHHIPFAIDEVFLDYHALAAHHGTMDLILVAVKKSKVMEYLMVVEEAGLQPVIVDVDGFALSNQHELNHPDDSREAVALIDIGASIMKTNVMKGGATLFARDIPFGGSLYTQAISQRLGIPFEQAEAAKLAKEASVKWESLVPALEEVSRELSLEVQRTFDYFASTAESEPIGKIVLAGGCAQLPGLSEYLSSTWGIPVDLASPFDRIHVDPAHELEIAEAGPSLAVAVGLSLRRPGDKHA